MIKSWRLLVAAAVFLAAGSGVAVAQTVMVRHAPPGEAVEVVLNAAKVASGTIDSTGEATLPLDLNAISQAQIDANIFINSCDALHRIIVVERARLPDPQQPGCTRRDIAGLYWVRPVNTLVIDLGTPNPSLLLIKGKYSPSTPRTWNPSPTGLVLFGGGTYGSFRDAPLVFCGTVTPCTNKNSGFGYTAGVTYWFTSFLGAEATYIRPRDVTVQGSGATFSFTSALEPQIATISGKIGVPFGPVRLYGQVGPTYHEATFTTTDTIGGVAQTQAFKTTGWSWGFGGGIEVWLNSLFALYGDFAIPKVKGEDEAGGEGRIDDRYRFIAFGARVRIGRSLAPSRATASRP